MKLGTVFAFLAVLVFPRVVCADSAEDAYKDFDSAFTSEGPDAGTPPEKQKNDAEARGVPEKEKTLPDVGAEQQASAPADISKAAAAKSDAGFPNNLKLEGWVRNETAFRVRSPEQLSKEKNIAFLTQSASIGDNIQLKATERGFYDAVFDLTDHYPDNVRDDQDHQVELRDTYVDYSAGDFDIRLGKQQIVWGEAVALFFADTVNAKDLREFVLPDFDQLRIPEWGADIDYTRGDAHVELVYIPFPEMDELGVENSEYQFDLGVPDGVPFELRGASEPANTFENSQYGTRVSYLVNGWDLGAFYLYTWDKFPVYFRSFDPQSSELVLTPDFRRQHIAGLTFSKDAAPVVWKGEFVLYPNGSFSTFDAADQDGVVRRTYLDYLLGGDIKLFETVDTNFQFLERIIFNHDDQLVGNEDAVRNYVSFWAKTTYFDGHLEPEFLILSSVMRVDMMIRPSVRYNFAERWDLKIGLDYFEGDRHELLGEFEHGSRAYTELTCRF